MIIHGHHHKKADDGDKKKTDDKGDDKGGDGDKKTTDTSTSATLVVNLPADASLTIDGNATKATSTRRIFVSPALEQGKQYYYTLKAKAMRNGKEEVITKRVDVAAGRTINVQLDLPVSRNVAAR